MDCGTKRDWSTVPKQYRCGSRLVPWQDYFGTDTVLEFLLGYSQHAIEGAECLTHGCYLI